MATIDNSQSPMAITAPTGGITAGSFKLIQNVLFFCPNAIAATEVGTGYWKNKIIRASPKTTGTAWTKGQALYWNNSTAKFQTNATGGTLRGFAAESAASGDATGDVELTGAVA